MNKQWEIGEKLFHLHGVDLRGVDTVSSCYDPLFSYQRPSTRDPLAEEALLDQGSPPRMAPERRIVAPYDPGLAPRRLNHPALGVLDRPEVWVDEVDLVPVDTAGPDHAPVAEIHGFVAREDTGGRQVTVVLVTTVPGQEVVCHKLNY